MIVVSRLRDLVIAGRLPGALNLSVQLVLLIAWIIAALTQRELYHRGLVALTSALMVGYIGVLFGQLR